MCSLLFRTTPSGTRLANTLVNSCSSTRIEDREGICSEETGIGSAPVLEMYQGTFGGLAFKNGNVDIKNWSEKDRGKVITDQIKAIKKDIKDEALDPNSDAGKQQIIDKIKQLEYWDSNNKSIKDFKKAMGLE